MNQVPINNIISLCTKIGDASNLCTLGQVLAAVWAREDQRIHAPNLGFRVQGLGKNRRENTRNHPPAFSFMTTHTLSFRTMPTRCSPPHIHKYTPQNTHSSQTHAHARAHARTHTHIYTHTHARTRKRTHIHTNAHIQPHTHSYLYTRVHTHKRCEHLCRLANGGHQTIRERRRLKTAPLQLLCGNG
jgi:hypothetical protein